MIDKERFIGKQLGGYRITALLNSGSFGSVYLAHHLIFVNEPPVAMKVLHAPAISSEECEQFLHEARLLKRLIHPFILPLIDAGFQDGFGYIIMPYASSGSLRDRINQQAGRPFPLQEALTILNQVGQALQYAHQHQIVHRDIKPANILFNAQGEALLADFGIAALLESSGTQRLDRSGTPTYMAPEQFEAIVSIKSDQYALGCIAYELVTGRKPFTVPSPSIEALWYQHAKVQPMSPSHYVPQIPSSVEHAILKALAKQRSDRHSDIAAFLSALQHQPMTHLLHESYEEALTACEQALRHDPNNATLHIAKGDLLFHLVLYEQALMAYEQAIHLDPHDTLAWQGKGHSLFEQHQYEAALTAYDKVISLDHTNIVAQLGKGNSLLELRRYEEALFSYKNLFGSSKMPILSLKIGDTLVFLGKLSEALRAYEQAQQAETQVSSSFSLEKVMKFSPESRNVLHFAQQEAHRLHQSYVGTEHLLLGLLRANNSAAAEVLKSAGVILHKVRSATTYVTSHDSYYFGQVPPVTEDIDLTPRSKQIIGLALEEAQSHHENIKPEHLLLAIIHHGDGIAFGILEMLSGDIKKVREHLLQLVNRPEVQTNQPQ